MELLVIYKQLAFFYKLLKIFDDELDIVAFGFLIRKAGKRDLNSESKIKQMCVSVNIIRIKRILLEGV